jgi:hypothetical protein
LKIPYAIPLPQAGRGRSDPLRFNLNSSRSSSLLKNLEMESFRILAGRCWGGAVELDVIF